MTLTCEKCKHKWEVLACRLARHPRPLSKCPKCKGQGDVSDADLRQLIARDHTARMVGKVARSDKTPEAKDKVMQEHYKNQSKRIDEKMRKLGRKTTG